MNNLNNLSEVYSLLESDALKNKIISISVYITNIIKRYILQVLMTNNMRQFVFQKFARKSVKGWKYGK